MARLFLAGDVMTGRGIDQILPHPSEPRLQEPHVHDARDYVWLAEQASGPIPQPAPFTWIWGEALAELERRAPDARIVNLETSITRNANPWRGKEIHYRMHPGNVACLSDARIDVCALANNHLLDYGRAGLLETVDVLRAAGIAPAGAGRTVEEAWAPAMATLRGHGRVLVFSLGLPSSGIPIEWAAEAHRPGVALLHELSDETAREVIERIRRARSPGDLVVASIHWGSNWGWEIDGEMIRFAHQLVDGGVDLVHGHSSHHPIGIEVYQRRLILYGCGDLINDYEGISGYDEFRGDLRLLYFAQVSESSGALEALELVPLAARRMRLEPATAGDLAWLADRLERASRPFGTRFVAAEGEGELRLELGHVRAEERPPESPRPE